MSNYKEYESSTEGLKKIYPEKSFINAGWNSHLPVPVTESSDVYLHPDQSDVPEKYIRVIHGEEKAISVFLETHFSI